MSEFIGEGTRLCMPAPPPHMVRAARDYLTPRFAGCIDAVLWEFIAHPLPDLDAIDAVNTVSARAQEGAGDPPEPMAVASALVVLSAARLDLDQTEARLLTTAQASGLDWKQIAAILDLTAGQAEERYRQLKPRLDHPAAEIRTPHIFDRPGHRPRAAAARRHPPSRTSAYPPLPAGQPATWNELEDGPWEP